MRRYPKKGGQFAIIWVDLLYEDAVPQSAKILYGEIYRLSGADGYCDASNQDFMDLLGCSETTVRNLLKALVAVGQIRIASGPKRGGKGGTSRRIFCARRLADPDQDEVPAENCGDSKNLREVPAENCGDSKNLREVPAENCGRTYLRNKRDNNPLYPPTEVLDAIDSYIGDDPEYRAAFDGFLANRKAMKKPVLTARAINAIINRLRRANHRETEIAMLDKATENNWLTVYPLKPDERPGRVAATQGDEEGIDGL